MAKDRLNGWIKIFFIALAVAGIIWNAAVLHNDTAHIERDITEIKRDIRDIRNLLTK